MNSRKPPRLANLLLERLRYFERNEALAGDLQEEFASGRSGRWYWRQALQVIGRGVRRNVASDWPGLIFVILVGYLPQLCCVLLLRRYLALSPRWLGNAATALVYVSLVVPLVRRRMKLPPLRVNAFLLLAYWIILLPISIAFDSAPLTITAEALILAAVLAVLGVKLAECPKPEPKWVAPPLFCAQCDEIVLQVELTDGRVIFLRPENLTGSILAAGDDGLVWAMFGRGASIETLRRALWLGCVGREQPVKVTDLSALVDEAADKEHVQQAFIVRWE